MEESVILSREMETCQDLLSGSGDLRNAAARTCFGVGHRLGCFKSNDASHDYDGNDNGDNTASPPFPIVRIVWVFDADLVGRHADLLTRRSKRGGSVSWVSSGAASNVPPVPRGTVFGRKAVLDAGERRKFAERYAAGETMAELAREYDCGVATIHRVVGRSKKN